MNYFIYTYIISLLTGRYELNKLTSLPMCGFIAQLVEHRTGIAEVTGSNPVEALIFFFQASSFQLLKNWKIHCEDHSSLSSMTAVQIYELFHIYLHQCNYYLQSRALSTTPVTIQLRQQMCNLTVERRTPRKTLISTTQL